MFIKIAKKLETEINLYQKYADDTTCYNAVLRYPVATNDDIQQAADYCKNWSSENSMLLNAKKTKTMTITLRKDPPKVNPVVIEDTVLDEVDSFKLLGVTVDSKLSFKPHVESVVSKARRCSHVIVVLKRQGIDTKTLVSAYLSRVRSVLTYAAPAWFSMAGVGLQDKIISVERLCLKIILPEKDTYEERLDVLRITPIAEFISNLCLKMWKKVEAYPEHPLHTKLNSVCRQNRRYSTRSAAQYKIELCRTETRHRCFLNYVINRHDL
jgi:hypothetical protein